MPENPWRNPASPASMLASRRILFHSGGQVVHDLWGQRGPEAGPANEGPPLTWQWSRGLRDREIIQRIKDATDLAALVGQAVKLRRQGSAWVGLCPFHSERTPSFQVVAERGFYHCFGCGKHGDAFTWLMERDGLAFPEAMEQLAQAAGIEVPRQRERPAAELDLEARLRQALEAAQAFYQRPAAGEPQGPRLPARSRGMTADFIQEAGLGYAPDAWEALLTHLRREGFSAELAEQAGLVSRSERGNPIDFLRDRLVIPDPRPARAGPSPSAAGPSAAPSPST